MQKIIVYDFDKTLTYKDTLFAFFRHAAKKNILYPFKIVLYFCCMVGAKFKIITNTQLKKIGTRLFLYNINQKDFMKACHSYKNHIKFNQLYKNLEYDKNITYYIVTASFENYVRELFPKFVHVIGSKLNLKNDKIRSLIFNCYHVSKVDALKDVGVDKIDIFYTDSITDLDLAKLSEKIYAVKGDKTTYCKDIDAFKTFFKK